MAENTCTTASEQKRLQQLFNAEEVGYRTPSQLCDECSSNWERKPATHCDYAVTDGVFLREIFLQRLSQNVRIVLASTPDTGNLEDLAQLADKIVEVAVPSPY